MQDLSHARPTVTFPAKERHCLSPVLLLISYHVEGRSGWLRTKTQ